MVWERVKGSKCWPSLRVAIVGFAVFCSAISYYGFLDFAPTVIFDTPEATDITVREINLPKGYITVDSTPRPNYPSDGNTDIVITKSKEWILSPNQLHISLQIFAGSVLLPYLTGIFHKHFSGKILFAYPEEGSPSYYRLLAFGGAMTTLWYVILSTSLMKLKGGGIFSIVTSAYVGTAGFLGIISILLATMLLPEIPSGLYLQEDVDRYIHKLSRLAQSVTAIGIAGSIGGVLSFGIGRAANPRPFVLLFLTGIFLFPILGIVALLHLRIHKIEKEFRGF